MDPYLLINKVKSVLTDPLNFFDHLKKETGIKTAFTYFFFLSLISTILGFIVGLLFQDYYSYLLRQIIGFALPKPEYTIGMLLVSYGSTILASFVITGILHVWILIFGGKENYSKTYQLYVYSTTPTFAVGWIPFVGSLAWFYNVVLLIIGTQRVHNISKVKSILMYTIPVILMGLFFLVIVIFSLFILRENPNLFQNFIPPQ